MKILLFALSLMLIAVSCNKDAGTEYNQQKEEVNKEYRESVNDAAEQRNEELGDARDDLQEQQKEEAVDYVEESEGATINRPAQEIDVDESKDQ